MFSDRFSAKSFTYITLFNFHHAEGQVLLLNQLTIRKQVTLSDLLVGQAGAGQDYRCTEFLLMHLSGDWGPERASGSPGQCCL